jgi:hypothetical protein
VLLFFRMLISILFGVIGVFIVLWAIDLHIEMMAEMECLRNDFLEANESNVDELVESYFRSMQPKLGLRYAIA